MLKYEIPSDLRNIKDRFLTTCSENFRTLSMPRDSTHFSAPDRYVWHKQQEEMEREKNKIGKWLEKCLLFSICEFLAQDPFSTPGLNENFSHNQRELLYKMVSKHRNSKIRGPQPLWEVFGS